MAAAVPREIVIVQSKPRRPPLAQTRIDQDQCIERRRCNAALYDRMTQILNAVLGGKVTKQHLMELAVKIAAAKGIKIDRGAKRLKDGLICWFCENACEFVAPRAASPPGIDIVDGWAPSADEFEMPLPIDGVPWTFDPEETP
jgi:hypothetical protein